MSKMTLERLAGMVQSGFTEMNRRFDEVLARLDNHDREIMRHDNEISALDVRLGKIERKR